MAKKETSPELTEEFKKTLEQTKMLDREVDEELKKSFIAYAMAVNVSRAIPDVRDGLKPVHRRILYSMHELGLYSDKEFRKCARIVGDCLGKYHPHGDSSVYDALVRLAQDFSINEPLVEGHGNFGSVDGDSPAAMRYTEARLSKIATEMLRDLDKETVDFYPTFDDTGMQPTVLPSRFPNMLVNGSDGIAVGMATNIPPHNLGEVIDGTVAMIDDPDIAIDELMRYIPAPDFPTGATIMGRNGIKKAYMTGRGSIVIRSKCDIEEYSSGGGTRMRIVVTEIPYQVNKARLIESIANLVKAKRVDGISDIREESDRDGMRIVIELKKDANARVVLNYLYKHTALQVSDGLNMLALVDGTPKTLNLKEFIYYYLEHQKDVIKRRTRFDLNKAAERAHILEGLIIAQASIDEVVEICKTARDKTDCVEKLTASFLLDERQATAVAELRLYRLSHLEVDKLREELDELHKTIEDYGDILSHESRVMGIIREDLLEIKRKYASPRKTELDANFDGDIVDADLVPVEDVAISITHSGYVKRLPIKEYKAQRRGGKGITGHRPKDEDFVEDMFVCSSHDDLLIFSDKGKAYRIKAYEIPEAARASRGRAIVNIVQIDQGESVTATIPLVKKSGYIVFATEKGLIKKTPLREFERINKNGKMAINLNEGDRLIAAAFSAGDEDIMMASRLGRVIRFSERSVRSMGRGAIGVKAMRLAGSDDAIVGMVVADEKKRILAVSSKGYGKRSKVRDYASHGRSGQGMKGGTFNETTGYLACFKQVGDDEDIMIISSEGIIIRMHCSDIPVLGRASRGVRMMRLKGGYVASVAVTKREEDEETALPDAVTREAAAQEAEDVSYETDEEENEIGNEIAEDETDEDMAAEDASLDEEDEDEEEEGLDSLDYEGDEEEEKDEDDDL